MKIVIEIPDELYKHIHNENVYYLEDGEDLYTIVKNGTPLPKGHGRLIDGDALYKLFEQDNFIWEADSYILTAPTIIEADRGEEE